MLRYALRGLRRSPGFTITAVLTLGLGLGATAAMFDTVDRLMYRPLAYLRDPGSVHRLYWQWRNHGDRVTGTSGPYTRYLDIGRWTTSFSQVAAFYERDLPIGEGETARERRVAAVSGSYFGFFDAAPSLGRFFTPAEDEAPRGADVAVLSHAFWQAEFGGRNVVGEPLQVGNVRATIIGVAPPGFVGVTDANPAAVFLPITTYAASTGTDDSRTYFSTYRWGWVNVIGRRKAGVSVEAAEADAGRAFARSWSAASADSPNAPPLAEAEPAVAVAGVRPGGGPNPALEARTALWLAIVAGLVLAIAASNVANLILARGLRRRRETAVRQALGVSRLRLAADALVEGLLLAALGGGVALVVAQFGGAAIRRLLLPGDAGAAGVADPRTLVVTALAVVLVGTLLGLVPGLATDRAGPAGMLRGDRSGTNPGGARLRAVLLMGQAALTVMLLVGALLFARSLDAVRRLPLGYQPDGVVVVNRVVRGDFPGADSLKAMRETLLAAAAAHPGVASAAWVSSAPFISTSSTNLFVAGIDSVGRLGEFTYQATTPGYFAAMGTRILRGRGLSPDDRLGAPDVAVVSESMARALWPGLDPLGQCFRMRNPEAPCTTVVGVAEDMVQRDLTGGKRFHYYLSIDQYTRTSGWGMLLRLRGDPAREAESVRRALQAALPASAYLTVRPLGEIVDRERRSWRMGAVVFTAFGALALLVASVGLYGVIGFSVAERTRELGIRMALGAGRRRILGLVVGQGMRYAAVGTGVGTAGGFVAGRFVEPLLFRQTASDPGAYFSVVIVMLAVAAVASAVPAVRATRADPTRSLRAE